MRLAEGLHFGTEQAAVVAPYFLLITRDQCIPLGGCIHGHTAGITLVGIHNQRRHNRRPQEAAYLQRLLILRHIHQPMRLVAQAVRKTIIS